MWQNFLVVENNVEILKLFIQIFGFCKDFREISYVLTSFPYDFKLQQFSRNLNSFCDSLKACKIFWK